MTLTKLHDNLPTAIRGRNPDPEPRFIGALAAKWDAQRDDDKPTALGTRFRHSDAGKCARAIAYTAAGIPRSDPMDLTGVWNTSLGTLIHEQWQEALTDHVATKYPGATVAIEVKVGHDDLDGSGHIDAQITLTAPTKVIAYELKTIGGYGYKAAIGRAPRQTEAEGPKAEHVAQAALNGLGRNADEVIVGYLAKECISVSAARGLDDLGRFAAEWTFTRDEYEPIALAEKARIDAILGLVDNGELAARKFPPGTLPAGAEIIDPTTGRWEVTDQGQLVDFGTMWACGYCNHRTLCATTDPGRIPVTSVTIGGAS